MATPMSNLDSLPPPRRRGIYLLPNLFTTGTLFAGFYAVVASMKGWYETAALSVFAAMVMDALDGRIARLTHTQTEFGAQYDSLSDLVAFGVAPALVSYAWALKDFGKVGYVAAFIFAACTALRLARFNTQIGTLDKRYFQGFPSPAGAGLLTSLVWVCTNYDFPPQLCAPLLALVAILGGGLMVSNIRYRSFKDIDFKNKVPFFAIFTVVLIFAGIAFAPPQMLFLGFLSYAVTGVIETFWMRRKKRILRRHRTRARAARRERLNPMRMS